MSEPRKPGAFARAEAGSRRVTLILGLGVLAYVVGQFITNGIVARLAERFDGTESELANFLLFWLLARVWLFGVLPALGWLLGRFLEVRPFAFAATAALAGELFGALLITATGGVEMLVPTVGDAAMRGVTLLLGIGLTQLATTRGALAAAAAQVRADAEALARKAEYDEFLERAAQSPSPEPGPAAPAETKPPDGPAQ